MRDRRDTNIQAIKTVAHQGLDSFSKENPKVVHLHYRKCWGFAKEDIKADLERFERKIKLLEAYIENESFYENLKYELKVYIYPNELNPAAVAKWTQKGKNVLRYLKEKDYLVNELHDDGDYLELGGHEKWRQGPEGQAFDMAKEKLENYFNEQSTLHDYSKRRSEYEENLKESVNHFIRSYPRKVEREETEEEKKTADEKYVEARRKYLHNEILDLLSSITPLPAKQNNNARNNKICSSITILLSDHKDSQVKVTKHIMSQLPLIGYNQAAITLLPSKVIEKTIELAQKNIAREKAAETTSTLVKTSNEMTLTLPSSTQTETTPQTSPSTTDNNGRKRSDPISVRSKKTCSDSDTESSSCSDRSDCNSPIEMGYAEILDKNLSQEKINGTEQSVADLSSSPVIINKDKEYFSQKIDVKEQQEAGLQKMAGIVVQPIAQSNGHVKSTTADAINLTQASVTVPQQTLVATLPMMPMPSPVNMPNTIYSTASDNVVANQLKQRTDSYINDPAIAIQKITEIDTQARRLADQATMLSNQAIEISKANYDNPIKSMGSIGNSSATFFQPNSSSNQDSKLTSANRPKSVIASDGYKKYHQLTPQPDLQQENDDAPLNPLEIIDTMCTSLATVGFQAREIGQAVLEFYAGCKNLKTPPPQPSFSFTFLSGPRRHQSPMMSQSGPASAFHRARKLGHEN